MHRHVQAVRRVNDFRPPTAAGDNESIGPPDFTGVGAVHPTERLTPMSKRSPKHPSRFRTARTSTAALAAGMLLSLAMAPAVSSAETPSTSSTTVAPATTVDQPTTQAPSTTTPESTATNPAPPSSSAPSTSAPGPSTTVEAPTSTTPSSPTTPPESGTAHLYVTSFIPYPNGITPVQGARVRLTNNETGAVTMVTAPAELTLNVGTYSFETISWPDGLRLISGSGTVELGLLGNHIQISFARTDGGGDGSGTLQVVKADRVTGAKLPGASFIVSTCSGDVLGWETTGEGGVVNREVAPGCYRVKETAAPKGYVPESRSYTVDVSTDKVSTVTVYNTPVDHVTDRNPSGRTSLSSIPSGPVDRP